MARQGKVECSIDGIDDLDNNHSYNEEAWLAADASLRMAVEALWEAGAAVDNIEEAVAGALNDQMGG